MESNKEKLKNLEIYKMQDQIQSFVEMPEIYNNTLSYSKNTINSKNSKNNFNNTNSSSSLNNTQLENTNKSTILTYAGGIDRYVPYYLEKENNYWSNSLEKNINNNVNIDRINTFVNPSKVTEVKNDKTTSKLLEVVTPKINSKFGYFDEFKNEAYEKSHVLQSSSAFYNVNIYKIIIKF